MHQLKQLYSEMSEHEHQVQLFAFAAAVGQVGWREAKLWVETHPLFLKREPLGVNREDSSKTLSEGSCDLLWLYAIPNGGSRGSNAADAARVGSRMKAEGVKRGVPDLFLPVARDGFHGLYIEMKKMGGKLSREQKAFEGYCGQAGYKFEVCEGYWSAITALECYLKPYHSNGKV